MIYGLTKGQASPTSPLGLKTPVQVAGVVLEPFNSLAVAIALDASFVARANASDREQTKDILKRAIQHKGYALVDIFQSCVTFNKVNTHQWFKDHTYYLDDSHDPSDRAAAFAKAIKEEKLPLGVFYDNPKASFEENTGMYGDDPRPLYKRNVNQKKLAALIDSFKRAG